MPKENPTRFPAQTATEPATLAAAQAENAELKARLAELESAKTRIDADEELIAKKMARGLRREQAAAVIKRQREFDAKKQTKK